MRRSNGCWSFFTCSSSAEVNGVAIAAFLAVVEDEAVSAETFILYEVSDHLVHMIPAELLLLLVRRAVSDYHDLTFRSVAELCGNCREYSLRIISQRVRTSPEGDAWQFAEFSSALASIRNQSFVARLIWAWALAYAICIHITLAICWCNEFFILTIRYSVAVCIEAHTVSVNWAACRSLLAVELVSHAIAIAIRKNRLRNVHQPWVADFAVCIIQRIHPPQRFY